jgi:hypothetical protein
MAGNKANPGDTVTWSYPLGPMTVKGTNKVLEVLKPTVNKPTRYKLDNGNFVKAWEITEVIRK